MDPKEKELLEETIELGKQNNKILRSMQRATRWAQFFVIIKWAIIISLTVGTYYYIQPYLQTMIAMYQQIGKVSGMDLPAVDMGKLQEVLQKL